MDWITTKEAAAYLKIKPRTLLSWVRQGRIRGFPLSGIKRRVWRFQLQDLDAAVMQQSPTMVLSTTPAVLNEGRIT